VSSEDVNPPGAFTLALVDYPGLCFSCLSYDIKKGSSGLSVGVKKYRVSAHVILDYIAPLMRYS
jgi:hypothetical protein